MWRKMIRRVREAQGAAGVDVGERALDERHAPDETGHRRHVDDAQGDDDGPQPAPERGHDEDREEERRKREEGVEDPHDQRVDPPAVVAGDEAERDSDAGR